MIGGGVAVCLCDGETLTVRVRRLVIKAEPTLKSGSKNELENEGTILATIWQHHWQYQPNLATIG
jgi:hypothetical protein